MAGFPSTVNNPSSGQSTDFAFKAFRSLLDGSMVQQTTDAGDWGYTSLTPSATTVVKTGPGQLGRLITATATGNVTIFDNTAASGATILAASALVVGTLVFNVQFNVGLTVVLSGAGVATVTYR